MNASLLQRGDASAAAAGYASFGASSDASSRTCAWCRGAIAPRARRDSRYCSQQCRQTAFRLRRRRATEVAQDRPMRVAYADPPYPGLARRYYRNEPTYRGEVDHVALLAKLRTYDGWALSTSARALRDLLPLCPAEVRVCAWVKPGATPRATYGLHNQWEPLIVMPARCLRPGVRDWLRAHPARRGGTLPGRKPIAFCAWLFDVLGMVPGDELADLFPGTGIVGRAWAELSSRTSWATRSAPGFSDASRPCTADTSLLEERRIEHDASPVDERRVAPASGDGLPLFSALGAIHVPAEVDP